MGSQSRDPEQMPASQTDAGLQDGPVPRDGWPMEPREPDGSGLVCEPTEICSRPHLGPVWKRWP